MKIGSLFSGVAGLDRAVESFFDAEVAWFVEFEAAPSKVLAHHYPDVPNYGDVTTVDWANVEPVDIITGGSPCQDLSGAGRRRGMTEGTRSNLWVQMREAIASLKPRFVVWENVRGAYSATAVSEVESEPGLLGVFGESRPALRALGSSLSPTPLTSDTNGPGRHGTGGLDLRTVISLLPTPVASEGTKATNRQNAAQKAKTGQVWLTNVAHTIQQQSGASTNPPSGGGSPLWEE